MVDGIDEIVVETIGAVVEVATDSRKRSVRRVAWAVLLLVVVAIVAVIWLA